MYERCGCSLQWTVMVGRCAVRTVQKGTKKRLRARKGTRPNFLPFFPPSLVASFFFLAALGGGWPGIGVWSMFPLLPLAAFYFENSRRPIIRARIEEFIILARLACHLLTVHGCLAQLHSHRTHTDASLEKAHSSLRMTKCLFFSLSMHA